MEISALFFLGNTGAESVTFIIDIPFVEIRWPDIDTILIVRKGDVITGSVVGIIGISREGRIVMDPISEEIK